MPSPESYVDEISRPLVKPSYDSVEGIDSDKPQIIERTIRMCRDCYELKGQMCHNPDCVFCRATVGEVAQILDRLKIRPVIMGFREYL